MTKTLLLFANLGIGAVPAGAGTFPPARTSGSRAAAVALLPLLHAGLLAVDAFGEDGDRGAGISRWDACRSPRATFIGFAVN